MHDALSESAQEFELFEGARLFEIACALADCQPSYRSRVSRTATLDEISRIDFSSSLDRAELEVAGFGLYGIEGVLPPFYSRLVEESTDDESPLRDFLDVFSNRLISLLFWCTSQTRFDLLSVGGIGAIADSHSELTEFLFGFAGVSQESTLSAGLSKEFVAHYASLFALPGRPAKGLESLLEDFTGLPVAVDDSIGRASNVSLSIRADALVEVSRILSRLPGSSPVVEDMPIVYRAVSKVLSDANSERRRAP